MKVSIVMDGGYEHGMEVGLQEPILQMKERIQNHLGIPMASQTLSVLGWELMDGLDLEDYPFISHGTKIDLTISQTPESQPAVDPHQLHSTKINITIKFAARKLHIEADPVNDTVKTLKEKIHRIDGTPIKRMALFFSGKELEDEDRSLGECGVVCPFSEVVVGVKAVSLRSMSTGPPPSRKISFAVKTSSALLNGATISVEMSDLSTIKELTQTLITGETLPEDEYIFIHKQRIMREHCSLRWHGVESGECLYVFKGTVSREER
ncbi:unnamed protein product [Cuscuta epithymum]|uniref:Ubiquitin-like domain-containing protein n=1 Tax=Cuscuta epithymum TaxID=186058 RepID=A0AAV0DZP9_9ASTE|nr:unnamed protein product [Cuscuta epithymum]